MQPTLSVVIPAYGRLPALLDAVDSVQATDVEGVEILVADDASPDPLGPHLPPRNRHNIPIRCFRLGRNSGPQAARNLAIRRARHDYVAFLDSDDRFLPRKIDRVREEIARTGADLIFHAVLGAERYARLGELWNGRLRKFVPFGWFIVVVNPVVTPSLVIRRHGRLGPPSFRHAEDWAFLLHSVGPQTKVAFLNEELSAIHRPIGSDGGQSSDRWQMRKGEFAARSLLLREKTVGGIVKYSLGTAAGLVRIAADLLRGRYAIGRKARS